MGDKARTSSAKSTSTDKLAVAAIDFGTTCTGYAYYLRSKARNYVNDINTDQAWTGSAEMGLQAPTTVLMNPDQKFHSFGFEAETKYKSLSIKQKHGLWYYFRHFKMTLHHEKDLHRDYMLKDAGGKEMKAMLVFKEAIKYVKDHLLRKVKEAIRDDVRVTDITWVITVPAIWSDSAKQFMRESAMLAEIPMNQLTLALEPESAAIFCKELAITRSGGVDGAFLRAFDPAEKYVVVDLGGGTVDTTVHEVLKNGCLKELHAATGGPWGGELVNAAFEEFMAQLVTPEVFKKFCSEKTSQWLVLQKDFEKAKRQFSPNTEEIDISFPYDLEQMFNSSNHSDLTLTQRIKKIYTRSVEVVEHSMILTPSIMFGFFNKAIDEINDHLEGLLRSKELKTVSTILLVGGFSESQIVNKAIRDHFKTLRVIAPGSASAAILKGAVMFGIDTKIIASRISPYSYGVQTRTLYKSERHPRERVKYVNGRQVVDKVFHCHLEKGENVYVGNASGEKRYIITNRKNPNVYWNVYQSDKRDPVFVDEQNCKFLGRLTIRVPRHIKEEQISLKVMMTCRGTELEATAIEQNGRMKCDTKFDFLEKDYEQGCDDVSEAIEEQR